MSHFLSDLTRKSYTRPEKVVTEWSTPHKHGVGSALTIQLTGTPQAVAEADRAIRALPKWREALAWIATGAIDPAAMVATATAALALLDAPGGAAGDEAGAGAGDEEAGPDNNPF